uniref:Ig-like domain-containing protein n=1 Tax=Neogobius melanostomus TaxID=47308 RepID=A0A8C6SVJ0_9GOBI
MLCLCLFSFFFLCNYLLNFSMKTISTGTVVLQDSGFKEANFGDNVTLRCSCQNEKLALFTWYQQRLGGTPELISRWAKGSPSPTVMQRFRERFHIVQSPGELQTNLLTITGLQATDSATYFCGVQVFGPIQFKLGRGEPLELSCTVEAEACSGEKSVYWLKHGASQVIVHPGEDCETSARNCTVRLGIQSVEPTDAGVYYCVLSSCGEILFGNGTEVQITGAFNSFIHIFTFEIHLEEIGLLKSHCALLLSKITRTYSSRRHVPCSMYQKTNIVIALEPQVADPGSRLICGGVTPQKFSE